MVHRRRFLKIYSLKFYYVWQHFYFYRILNTENFKEELEQTNFVTHLIILHRGYYMAALGYEFYLQVLKVSHNFF